MQRLLKKKLPFCVNPEKNANLFFFSRRFYPRKKLKVEIGAISAATFCFYSTFRLSKENFFNDYSFPPRPLGFGVPAKDTHLKRFYDIIRIHGSWENGKLAKRR